MKIKLIPLVIVALIATLICYGIYTYCNNSLQLYITIASAIVVGVPLITTFGISFSDNRAGVNSRVLSMILIVVGFAVNLFFSLRESTSMPPLIIVNGLLFLVYLLSVYGAVNAKK